MGCHLADRPAASAGVVSLLQLGPRETPLFTWAPEPLGHLEFVKKTLGDYNQFLPELKRDLFVRYRERAMHYRERVVLER